MRQEPKPELSARQTFIDDFLAHVGVNSIAPLVVFPVLSNYNPKIVESIVEALGPSTLKYMPTVSIGISLALTGLQTAFRWCCGAKKKTDDRIHLPFDITLSRQQSIILMAVSWLLQTSNSVAQEYAADAAVTEVFHDLLSVDGMVSFLLLVASTGLLDRIINACCHSQGKSNDDFEHGHAGAHRLFGSISSTDSKQGGSNLLAALLDEHTRSLSGPASV